MTAPKSLAAQAVGGPPGRAGACYATAQAAVLVLLLGLGTPGCKQERSPASSAPSGPEVRGPVTFSKDIAPIVYRQCAPCHHPGQSAPFDLLTYSDVKKRARQIVEVTQSRYMPPWPPEPGYGDFTGERRLTDKEIELFRQWAATGTPEGHPAERPPIPSWPGGWLLGKPDAVLTLAEPFHLPAGGKDVYRNFVIPTTLSAPRYVRGLEFNPGNPKVVHHAFVKVDPTPQSRHLDEADPEPGFAGMNTPAEMPGGQFLTWQPGKLPAMSPDGLAWRLEPGNDLVLQMHLRPNGKPELIQPSVALYFTGQAPTNQCFKMALTSLTIDIPAGQSNYLVEDSFVLPVPVQVLAVLPHAHYLARRMEAWADLPDGSRQWLLLIKDWDFNWQGDYRYAQPVELPQGSTLRMRYTYDNSTNNVRNPNQPPQRVTYGPQSSDEMAEFWLQLLPRTASDAARLSARYQAKTLRTFAAREEHLLKLNPSDAKAHARLAESLLAQGKTAEGIRHLRAAASLDPQDDQPHYFLGLVYRRENKLRPAQTEFELALRLNPRNGKAHGNLGVIAAEQGDLAGAEAHFLAALQINPDDEIARSSLEELHRRRQDH